MCSLLSKSIKFVAGPLRKYQYRAVAQGGRPPDKVLAPLVGLGRYIESLQNKKFFNKNTLVNIKKFTSLRGKAPGFLYIQRM